MEKITLEKVDMVRERMNVTYEKAKEALEACDGDVLDAIIYIEKTKVSEKDNDNEETEKWDFDFSEEMKNFISLEEFKAFVKELIDKGNVTRIKIKKDDKELADIPVNAGVAGAIIGIIIPQILALVLITALVAQITIEITREDGSVEVVNKYVSKMAEDVKEKANDFAEAVKNKVNDVKKDSAAAKDNSKVFTADSDTVYTYTVNFDDEDAQK